MTIRWATRPTTWPNTGTFTLKITDNANPSRTATKVINYSLTSNFAFFRNPAYVTLRKLDTTGPTSHIIDLTALELTGAVGGVVYTATGTLTGATYSISGSNLIIDWPSSSPTSTPSALTIGASQNGGTETASTLMSITGQVGDYSSGGTIGSNNYGYANFVEAPSQSYPGTFSYTETQIFGVSGSGWTISAYQTTAIGGYATMSSAINGAHSNVNVSTTFTSRPPNLTADGFYKQAYQLSSKATLGSGSYQYLTYVDGIFVITLHSPLAIHCSPVTIAETGWAWPIAAQQIITVTGADSEHGTIPISGDPNPLVWSILNTGTITGSGDPHAEWNFVGSDRYLRIVWDTPPDPHGVSGVVNKVVNIQAVGQNGTATLAIPVTLTYYPAPTVTFTPNPANFIELNGSSFPMTKTIALNITTTDPSGCWMDISSTNYMDQVGTPGNGGYLVSAKTSTGAEVTTLNVSGTSWAYPIGTWGQMPDSYIPLSNHPGGGNGVEAIPIVWYLSAAPNPAINYVGRPSPENGTINFRVYNNVASRWTAVSIPVTLTHE